MSWTGAWAAGHGEGDARPFDARLLARLLAFARPHRRAFLGALVASLGGAVMTLAGPYLIKVAIDQGIAAHRSSVVLETAALYLLSRVAAAGLTAVEILSVNRLGNRAVYDIRKALFDHLLGLGFRFYDREPVGVVVSRGTNDVTALSNLVSSGIVSIVTDGATLFGIMAIMVAISPRLALASFVTLPLLAAVTLQFQRRARRAYRTVRQTIARLTADVAEGLSGVRVTQAFAREADNARRFAETNRQNLAANMEAAVVNNLFGPVASLIGTLGTAIVLGYGGWLSLQGVVTVGTLVAFVNYLSRFFQPIQDLTQQYNLVQQAMAAAEKLFGILDTPAEVVDAPDAREMPPIRGEVAFEGVTFGYRPDRPVLNDLSFCLPAGTRAALVGPTGAGKTTVTALLLRFYDPQAGRVRVDGIDLRGVRQTSYRRQVAVVLQDPVLFSGSVADNIRYGRLEATDREVEQVAAAVGADGFITSLPQGYATPVGERGTRLSQGQRQLIAFARALLADPRILILDEATASVDGRTEGLIREAMGVLLRGRTSLVIAHRLATVRESDTILVLDGGRLVEQGTHADLLAQGGRYARLYRSQFAPSRTA